MKEIKQLKELDRLGGRMRLAAEKWDSEWKTLIATILSARTRDEVTIKVSLKLFDKYPNVEDLGKANLKEVMEVINPVNFYKNKANNIILCARDLDFKFGGEVPHDFEKLGGLRGVGRKTANVFLSEVGKDAIGVDTHVSYISQKLGWVKSSNAGKIENELKELFPRRYWRRINPVLVRFGKKHTSRVEKDRVLGEIKNG